MRLPRLFADPEVVDELQPAARYTGIPEIERISIFHALNSKAVSRKYAASIGKHYEEFEFDCGSPGRWHLGRSTLSGQGN